MLISKAKSRLERSRNNVRGLSCYPRRRLTLQALFLVLVILITPLVTPSSFLETSYGGAEDESLAIDSPNFTLKALAMTEDGFLIKSAGQTASVDRSNLSDIITYTVESGDSLSSIAYRFGISMDTIVWENNLTNPHRLKIGSTLRILPVSGITYTARSSDTLEKIAKKYKLDPAKLARQNGLEVSSRLIANAKIIIPGGRRTITTSGRWIASSAPGRYAAYRPPVKIDGAIIVANGVKNKNGKWMIKPTPGVYTTYFGGRRGHWAVDIADRTSPPIEAAAAGTVVKSQCGWNGGYGCMIVIDHGGGFQTLYGHMSKLYVSVGEKVVQSQQIGKMGATGRVYGRTGIHLHFEVIDNGRKKNPLAYY